MPTAVGGATAIGGSIASAETLLHNEGNAATGGIWRVRGPAGTAVLKVARPPSSEPVGKPGWQTSDEPTHWNYWKREALAYSTGFAHSVYADAGITAPELLDLRERPDGSVELWLAEAMGAPGMSWSVARLARFAYQLGVAQARWVGRVPDYPWLSRGWLRQYLDARRVPTDADWDHPVAAPWPVEVRAQLRSLWQERDRVLAIAESLPTTLCHLDVWPTNLIDDGDRSILLDWSFTGEGGLGEDIANLIVDSVADGMMPADRLAAIDAEATGGYLTGLHDGGWSGDPDEIRRAIAVFGVAKYCWFAPAALVRASAGGAYGHSQYGQDRSGAEAIERLTGLVSMLARWFSAC